MPQNLSLLSIPFMYLTTLVPHAHAIGILSRATPPKTDDHNKDGAPLFDNANPHGTAAQTRLRATLPPTALAEFERAEAAHRNGVESLPLFAAGILAGNFAGVSAGALNWTAGVYLGLRILYNGLYIHTERRKASFARSVVWAVGQAVCISLFVRAAGVF